MVSRQVFNDFDENQETVVLKHKELGGEDLKDDKQHEPLSMIRKGLLNRFFFTQQEVSRVFSPKIIFSHLEFKEPF